MLVAHVYGRLVCFVGRRGCFAVPATGGARALQGWRKLQCSTAHHGWRAWVHDKQERPFRRSDLAYGLLSAIGCMKSCCATFCVAVAEAFCTLAAMLCARSAVSIRWQ